jgi:hypothetical protein
MQRHKGNTYPPPECVYYYSTYYKAVCVGGGGEQGRTCATNADREKKRGWGGGEGDV